MLYCRYFSHEQNSYWFEAKKYFAAMHSFFLINSILLIHRIFFEIVTEFEFLTLIIWLLF